MWWINSNIRVREEYFSSIWEYKNNVLSRFCSFESTIYLIWNHWISLDFYLHLYAFCIAGTECRTADIFSLESLRTTLSSKSIHYYVFLCDTTKLTCRFFGGFFHAWNGSSRRKGRRTEKKRCLLRYYGQFCFLLVVIVLYDYW